MQRSLYQQAVRMHGQDLSMLTEKHQQENFVFVEDEHEEQLADVRVEECHQRESSTNHPDTTPVGHYQDGVRLTGTMRDLVHVQSRTTVDSVSSTEESSKSDTSPEILPLGVPRELHEPFDDERPSKTELFKLQNNGFASKLHNFISKKADILFKVTPADKEPTTVPNIQDTIDLDYYATLPPMEQFMVIPADQSRKRLFEILSIGDIIAGSIVAIKDFGMFVQVVCLCGKDPRYLQECDIVGLLPKGELGDRYSQKAQLEDFRAGDVVRCRVVKTDAANEKVILTMINLGEESEGNLLGIISESDLPVHYRRSQTQRETGESYDEMLDNTLGFDNPYNISCLTKMLNIDDTSPPSLMPGLQSANFPEEEHAEALRKWQSHKWAMESVARGVEHFKADRHLEAMQQLNRALEIDAENVEGLVARGALFANQNNLSKAIKDFAEALRIKPSHKNANRYMCQTLYEKGKQCEENDEKDKAMDCYQSAVDLNADFQEALVSLERLQKPSRRKSVRDESEEEGVISTSEESPQEQMSAKQLRDMISEEKSSAKKKKKKDKHAKGHEDGKGDRKVKKELKMGKKKKKKKLRRKSSSPEVISKQKQKEPSSDSESESSEPPSPPPKHSEIKKGSKGDNPKEPVSPEGSRLTGRKRSRNGSFSPKRKSRSKTRKADLVRKKSKNASETSSSEDDKPVEQKPKKDKKNRSKSLERSDSTKAKRKGDKSRRKESESSSVVSSSEGEQAKKSKKKIKKEGKDRSMKEEVSHKKRKLKTKKEKVKRNRSSSSSVSEDSADSLSYSPMRKKSKQSKKVKKMHKRSKKRSESVSSSPSASGSESERKPSPPRKVHKKRKKNKKKKAKKKERSSSVSSPSVESSESPERPKSPEEPAKKRKHKKKTKEEDHYSDRYSSDSSSSSKQAKISTKGKKEVNTRMDDKSRTLSDRRSRSASVGLKERAPKVSSDEGEDIKIGKKRSRSNDFGLAKVKDHPKRQSKEAVHSPPSERQRRRKRTSDEASDESEERHVRKKEERTRKKLPESPAEERPQPGGIEKTRNKEKREKGEDDEDRSSRRSKRHSKAHSPVEQRREKSLSLDRSMSKDRDKKKSQKSISPAPLSPRKGGHSEDRKQDKVTKPSEYRNERSRSREKHKADDEMDKKKPRRSYSSASESPPRARSPEDKKQEKSAKHSKSREDNLEKSSRRSRSLSPKTRKEEEKEQRTPIRERKRKRSGSFKTESSLSEKDRPDRKSRGGENYEEKDRPRKESASETHKRKDSPRESSHRSKSADDRVDRRKESPRESKKNHSRHSPSHTERNDDRRRSIPSHAERSDDRLRSSVEVDQNKHSRSRRSASPNKQDRKQRSKSGSYDRDKERDRRPGEKDRDMDKRESKEMSGRESKDVSGRESKDVSGRESKDASRRKSSSQDREDHYRERHLSDGDKHRHRSSEDTKQKSSERERPRSREDDRKRESRNADRRTSYEVRKDDREREKDRSNERQDHDGDRPSRRKSREKERSKERDRRESGKNADSSRERRDRSRESERQVSGSKSESSRRDKRVQSEASKENGKVGTKGQESDSVKNAPALNVQDIPMPPEKAPLVETKKEPSPILYVTSSSCKDEIIKVKSKWDTDSEDDESGASGPQNQRGGGRGTSGFQRSYGQSSQYSGSNGSGGVGGGQNYGGYSRHAEDNCHDNKSSIKNCSGAPQNCPHLSVAAEQPSYHEPLRLRGGCVASPPPKYESDYSDSDVSFSSSSYVDSEEPKRDSSREGRQRRHKSSSSDRSSGGRRKKRFKPSSRRESRSSSHSSSRSSSASSSRSHSSRSSSRSDISYSSQSHSRSSSLRSSSSYSQRNHSSDSRSSKASQSHVKSRDSSDKPTKTQSHEDAVSDTESSDAEGASAYNLFDSWEDYMDSKGHSIGKEVPSSVIDKRTVKLEAGGSIVGKGSRRSPFSTSGEEHSEDDEKEENPNPIETDENIEKKVRKTAQNKRVADDNISGGNAKYSRPSDDVTENERKSDIDAAENKQSRSMGDAQNLSRHKETEHEKHSRKRGETTSELEKVETRQYRDSTADIQYSYGRDYERREARTDSRDLYRHSSSSDGGYSSGYGNQLKVGYSHVSHRDHPNADRGYHAGDRPVGDHRGNRYNDGRFYRSDRSREDDRHLPRHAYPQQEVRRDFRQHPERGFESQRYRRREHGFRRRRDDDDWGRGVTEVKERGTFLGLVTNSKEDLVSKLYSVCSTASKLLHVHGEHRQWWL